MENLKFINAPLKEEDILSLKSGDEVLLSGIIYTARDQAHLRMANMIEKGERLPVDVNGLSIYYCGPTPPAGRVIGSCGPTTSGRMDPFTPMLIERGLKVMIGKGSRSKPVIEAIKKYKAVYFIAPAGCGAYLSSKVKSCELVAFEDLGPEAIYRLEVKDFPVIVCIDCNGNSIYDKISE